MPTLLGLWLASVGAASAAAPLDDCYGSATAAHPQATISVGVNGKHAIGPTHDVRDVFEAVAAAPAGASITVTRNADGQRSLEQAMTCMLDADVVTWSMVRLHELDASLRVRAKGLARVTDGSQSTTLQSATLQGGVDGRYVIALSGRRPSTDSCLTLGIDVAPIPGSADFLFATPLEAGTKRAAHAQTCEGQNCRACAIQEDGRGCAPCEEAGDGQSTPTCNHTVSSSAVTVPADGYLFGAAF